MTDMSLPMGMREVQNRYILPSFVERTSYGIKEMNPYNKMFEERIIFLGVQIDDASANDVMAQLLTLESMDPDRDIVMYINSPGGSFTAMTAIYDTMQFVRPDIQTVCMATARGRTSRSRRARYCVCAVCSRTCWPATRVRPRRRSARTSTVTKF
jgi:ATP-dependent Clp protease protease subunit